ncbi:MAG: hypothetical protein WCK69_02885 [Candidatus Saccharibacteria bacterium]
MISGDHIYSIEDIKLVYSKVNEPIPILDELAQQRTKALLDEAGYWIVAGALVSKEVQTLGIAIDLAMHDAPFFSNVDKSIAEIMVGPEFLEGVYEPGGVAIWTRNRDGTTG